MNKNDTEAIVKEFLELWQKQFSYMSREDAYVDQGIDAFTKMQEAYLNSLSAGLGSTGNAKSATTSDILRNIGREFTKLAKSYAELEGRIAKLESESRGGRENPASQTSGNKPI